MNYLDRHSDELNATLFKLLNQAKSIQLCIDGCHSDYLIYPGFDKTYVKKSLTETRKEIAQLLKDIRATAINE